MAQIPFVGPSYNLTRRPHSVQRSVNLMPVPQEPGNERTKWVFRDVPGIELVADLSGLSLLRITEAGEPRITEAGEDRVIEG